MNTREKLKIVKLKAGLGNQMFQYAFYLLLKSEYNCSNVLIDTSYYDNIGYRKYLDCGLGLLSVRFDVATKEALRRIKVPYNSFKPHHFMHRFVVMFQILFNRYYYFERNRQFIDVKKVLEYSYFDGYWQSWRYLEPISGQLYIDFQPKNELSDLSKKSINRYEGQNSVFVGVRRGDYAATTKSKKHFGTPSEAYYSEGIKIINRTVDNPLFVIFSDDIGWVKANLDFSSMGVDKDRIEFREDNLVFSNFEELYVMASCKHAIISNSTFNFWGAWLIENPSKVVIAPKQWFSDGRKIDIIPPTWIQI